MKLETAAVSRPRRNRTEIPAGHGWLGIAPVLVAIAVNVRFFAARLPGTPLRVLLLIACDAALRARGIIMTADRRKAVIEAMELGALLNDRFDGDPYNTDALRARVSWFAHSAHREVVWNYAKRLRRLERTRPDPGDCAAVVKCYRENVNRVSLAALWALASARTLAAAELEIECEADLHLLFKIVMQTQLIDDLLDVRHDRARGLPSFAAGADVTAASLLELVSVYSDLTPIQLDRSFCLRVALKIVAASAWILIALRTPIFTTRI